MSDRTAIVTDSTADFDRETIARYNLHVLPLHIVYEDRTYRDGVDITKEEIYDRLDEEIPKTASPSPLEAADLLRGLAGRGFTHAVAVHIARNLSATADTVALAAREVPEIETTVVDSKTVSGGTALIVEQAARWRDEGLAAKDIVRRCLEMVGRTRIYCVLKTLEYFRRGGRIGSVAATVAGLLNIKPIATVDEEGRFYSCARVRGRKQSIQELFRIALSAVESGANRFVVMHSAALEEAQDLLERIRGLAGVKETALRELGPTIGVHSGPGLVGFGLTEV